MDIKTIFFCRSIDKMQSQDAKEPIKNSFCCYLVDNDKKNQSEKNYTPTSTANIYLVNTDSLPISVGKKYKLTIEEFK